jgi:phage tail-like protein
VNRGAWLIDQLPVAMLDDDFLVRFLGIFQTMADSYIVQVDAIEHLLDVSVTPEPMVRFLGSWLGARTIDPSLDPMTQRRIVREQGRMLPWRGTVRGLRQLLEMVTGGPVVVVDSGGVYAEGDAPENPGHVHIEVLSLGWATEDDLIALIQSDLPASVTFDLHVGARRLWPREVAAAVASGSQDAAVIE